MLLQLRQCECVILITKYPRLGLLTDTYGVEIDEGQNDILIMAIAIAIDMMSHDEDTKRRK